MPERTHFGNLHAHEDWASRDCDGPLSGGSIWWLDNVPLEVIADDDLANHRFRAMVLGSIASFDPEYAMQVELTTYRRIVVPDPEASHDGQCLAISGDDDCDCGYFEWVHDPIIRWSQAHEEGGGSGEARICDDPDCRHSEQAWRRDHWAEAAGY